jgi:adenylate kinase
MTVPNTQPHRPATVVHVRPIVTVTDEHQVRRDAAERILEHAVTGRLDTHQAINQVIRLLEGPREDG